MLRTDYKDDVLQSGETKRKYTMTQSGGYVSFEDETVYQQQGDIIGAALINAITTELNRCYEYVSATLPAGQTSVTLTAPNDNPAFFFEGGHVEVYVPESKVQDLVVAGTRITPSSGGSRSTCVVTFSSYVGSNSEIHVYCK